MSANKDKEQSRIELLLEKILAEQRLTNALLKQIKSNKRELLAEDRAKRKAMCHT